MRLQYPMYIIDINNIWNFREEDVKNMLCNHLKDKYYIYVRDSSGKIFAALSFHIHSDKNSINIEGVRRIHNEIYDRCSDWRWEANVPIENKFKIYVTTERKSYYEKIMLSEIYFKDNIYKIRTPYDDTYPSPWIWRLPDFYE